MPDRKTPRVILVEDHTMVRQLFAHLVRDQLGLQLAADCTTVAEGETALLREKPDLAIIDWMLPDGRGFDLVRATRAKLPKTRWLLVSSNEQPHLVREAVSLGIHGCVLKRSDVSTLRTAITKILAGEKYYCAESSRLLIDKMVDESCELSNREQEVLTCFARGASLKEIADRLSISLRTSQNTLADVREKLGLQEPAELVHYAIKHGYVEAP